MRCGELLLLPKVEAVGVDGNADVNEVDGTADCDMQWLLATISCDIVETTDCVCEL